MDAFLLVPSPSLPRLWLAPQSMAKEVSIKMYLINIYNVFLDTRSCYVVQDDLEL